jgi:hypothetical protein
MSPNARTAYEVVQAQLDAYNARDIDAFCAQFDADAQLFELGETTPVTAGLAAIRARYAELFARSPRLYSHVVNRTTFGRVVVDLEDVTGRNGSDEVFKVMAIYEVVAGLIARVHFARP